MGSSPITVEFRLSAVRGFARYLHAIDPAHEIPPLGLLAVPACWNVVSVAAAPSRTRSAS
jgi:hypothetical protein